MNRLIGALQRKARRPVAVDIYDMIRNEGEPPAPADINATTAAAAIAVVRDLWASA